MKSKRIIVIAVLICAALVAGSAWAGQGGCPFSRGKKSYGDKKDAIASKLNLTPEQDKLLKEAKEGHRKGMEEQRKALKEKHEALKNALSKPGVTKEQVEPIAAQIKAIQSRIVDDRVNGILRIKEILTPEQYQKLQEMKSGWKKNGHGSRGDKNKIHKR